MKQFFLRCFLAICVCGFSINASAEWVTVFEEDFSGIDFDNPVVANWTFSKCGGKYNDDKSNTSLYVKYTKYGGGSAQTPTLGHAGDFLLTFTYARSSQNSAATLTVTLQGSGSITESAVFSPSSATLVGASLHITGATATTRIKFSASVGGIAIDDVLVQREVGDNCAAPVFSIAEGYYNSTQSLTMSCATEGAAIYYTLDGTEPSNSSTPYTTAVSITETTTVKAVAYKGTTASAVTTATYTVGEFYYGEAFTAEGGSKSLTTGSPFVVDDVYCGQSAVLTLRLYGLTGSATASVTVTEKNSSYSDRPIVSSRSLNVSQDVWTPHTIAIPILRQDSKVRVTVGGANVLLDDVLLKAPPTITLDENATNTAELLATYEGQVVDVATRRTLRGGIWNTLCLPFDVNRADLNIAVDKENTPQSTTMTTFTSYGDGVMTFSSVENSTTIPAGTPFLMKIKVNSENPTFRAVTISRTTPLTVSDGGVSFTGCFGATTLKTDGTELFLGTDNVLYSPAAGKNTIGGLRAFIQRTNSHARIAVAFSGEETAGVGGFKSEPTTTGAVYTLQGQRVERPRRGVYVREGKKIIIK